MSTAIKKEDRQAVKGAGSKSTAKSDAGPKMTGAQALAFLKSEGVIGTWSDRPDSPDLARELRTAAETRERED